MAPAPDEDPGSIHFDPILIFIAELGAVFSLAGIALWWGPGACLLEVRQHGLVVYGLTRVDWDELTSFRWWAGWATLRTRRKDYHLPSAARQRQALVDVLAEHAAFEG